MCATKLAMLAEREHREQGVIRGSLFDHLSGNGTRAQLRKAGINCFAGRLFTAAATAGDRQMMLDLGQRARSPVYEVANLPI